MADEPKAPPSGGPSETPAKPSNEAAGSAPAKPAAGAPPAKPPAPPPKPATKPDPWTSPWLEELQKKFPGAVTDAQIFRNEPSITVTKEALPGICEYMKSPEGGAFTLLEDETAVDYPKREKRFDVVYHIYSFQRNERIRVKVIAGEGEKVPSVVGIWPTANWLEREVFDMFGVAYEGHPDLKRILLPDEWVGHPLRKDYDILRQDDAWVQTNLNIKSGQ